MTDTLIPTLGSLASIIALILVLTDKKQEELVKGLMFVIVALAIYTGILLNENRTYKSEQYQQISARFQQSLDQSKTAREAADLLSTFPGTINPSDAGSNEGIIYSVLAFLESNSESFPSLYTQFNTNVIANIETAKSKGNSFETQEVLHSGAKSAVMLLGGIAGPEN